MSAFLVTDDDCRLIAQAAQLYAPSGYYDPQKGLATRLYIANVKSINYRYAQNHGAEKPHHITYEPVVVTDDPRAFKLLALAVIHCYRYQSCEPPEWEGSYPEQLTRQIHDAIRATLPDACETDAGCCREFPEWGADRCLAPWGIGEFFNRPEYAEARKAHQPYRLPSRARELQPA